MNDLYPFEGHYLDRDGVRQHYLDEGEGAPVVMLHGNPTWSFYYRNLAIALREKHRVIVPDHVGCGYSDVPDDEHYSYTLAQRVSDVESLLDELGIVEGITLIVHDWGGMIGMAYATRHPERIKRLVVMNTSSFRLPESKPFPWALSLVRNTPLGAFLVRRFNAFSYVASYIGCKRNPMTPEIRKMYRSPYDTWKNRLATLRFVEDIPLRAGDPGYEEVVRVEDGIESLQSVPMLICWGLKDFVFDHHFLSGWEERFPNADVHRFEDCGHYILEDASDEVIPLINTFLEST